MIFARADFVNVHRSWTVWLPALGWVWLTKMALPAVALVPELKLKMIELLEPRVYGTLLRAFTLFPAFALPSKYILLRSPRTKFWYTRSYLLTPALVVPLMVRLTPKSGRGS